MAEVKTFSGTCIPWWGYLTKGGYGVVKRNGRTQTAHRVIYEECLGPIPDGMQLDHLCRNRACVNPGHLEPVSPAENTRRGKGNRHAGKTHCLHGHPFDEANTRPRSSGWRTCRACHRRRERMAYVPTGRPPSAEKTHCPQGHHYDAANTYRDSKGKRHCRACHGQRQRAIRRHAPSQVNTEAYRRAAQTA